MKVKAIAVGFFDKYRRPGDEFDIDNEKQFSKKWMIKIPKPKAAPRQKVKVESE